MKKILFLIIFSMSNISGVSESVELKIQYKALQCVLHAEQQSAESMIGIATSAITNARRNIQSAKAK